MGGTWKNGSHFKLWVTLGKMGHTWKNGSHLEKWAVLGIMSHSLKKGVSQGGKMRQPGNKVYKGD